MGRVRLPMTDAHDKHERRSTTAVIVLCVMIGLPVVYLLSVGPMEWLYLHGYIAHESVVWNLYTPVMWLRDNSETASRVLDWYVLLWH